MFGRWNHKLQLYKAEVLHLIKHCQQNTSCCYRGSWPVFAEQKSMARLETRVDHGLPVACFHRPIMHMGACHVEDCTP